MNCPFPKNVLITLCFVISYSVGYGQLDSVDHTKVEEMKEQAYEFCTTGRTLQWMMNCDCFKDLVPAYIEKRISEENAKALTVFKTHGLQASEKACLEGEYIVLRNGRASPTVNGEPPARLQNMPLTDPCKLVEDYNAGHKVDLKILYHTVYNTSSALMNLPKDTTCMVRQQIYDHYYAKFCDDNSSGGSGQPANSTTGDSEYCKCLATELTNGWMITVGNGGTYNSSTSVRLESEAMSKCKK